MNSLAFLLDQVHSLLGRRHPFLGTIQFQRSLWYVLGLILVPGRRTTRRMKKLIPGCPTDRFGISRTLNDQKLRARQLLQVLGHRALLKALSRKPTRKIYLILDTTNIQRFGKHIESAFRFKDSSTRGFILGHRTVVSMALVGRSVIPMGNRLFVRKEDAPPLGTTYKSQIDLAEELIEEFPHLPGVEVEVLADSFFFCAQIVKVCRRIGYHLTTRARSNQKVTGPRQGRSSFLGDKIRRAYKERRARRLQVTIRDRSRNFMIVHRRHRFRRIGWMNTVYSRECKHGPKTIAIVTTDLNASPAEIMRRHSCRWAIELLFRATKLDLGMGHFQGRHWEGVDQHLQLTLISHLLLSHAGSKSLSAMGKSSKGATLSGLEDLKMGRAQLHQAMVHDLFGRTRTRKGAEEAISSRISMIFNT